MSDATRLLRPLLDALTSPLLSEFCRISSRRSAKGMSSLPRLSPSSARRRDDRDTLSASLPVSDASFNGAAKLTNEVVESRLCSMLLRCPSNVLDGLGDNVGEGPLSGNEEVGVTTLSSLGDSSNVSWASLLPATTRVAEPIGLSDGRATLPLGDSSERVRGSLSAVT